MWGKLYTYSTEKCNVIPVVAFRPSSVTDNMRGEGIVPSQAMKCYCLYWCFDIHTIYNAVALCYGLKAANSYLTFLIDVNDGGR